MAIDISDSHYNTGTATVAANGTAVTGQGTAWLGTIRKGDLFGTHKGAGVRILAVNSNTSITLAYPWTGGAQAAALYEIQRTPFDVGYLQAIEDMIRLYGIGNLPSLAGLDGTGGNKGLMLTGAGTADTFALTAFMRTLLANADAATARATLGANNAVNLTAGLLDIARVPATLTPDKAFRRGNVIGTVSQVAGVPTGALSSGWIQNANGTYLRDASGFQICISPAILVDISTVTGTIYRGFSDPWVYPAAFASSTSTLVSTTVNDYRSWGGAFGTASSTQAVLRGFSTVSQTGVAVSGFAIGKWF